MRAYRTELGYKVSLGIDSVGSLYRAGTNDIDLYHKEIADLDWKPLDEAQADLDMIASRNGLKEDRI